jgi:HPt (histidine-containing phosphotransfer) domain-containing protein
MEKLALAVDQKHYENMKTAAHTLKGASGYIGASRIHYACFYI